MALVGLNLATRAWQDPAATTTSARYVGRARCAACHPAETEAFVGSHHDLAMQPPTPQTVLGDFGGSSFTHFDVTSTFTRKGEDFVVRTDGPDGALRDYRVAYVFGVTPLQQYLLDIGNGRLQGLSIAWDSRPAADGGQRWFHLYPNEKLPAGDELHWTGIQQNWNFMCAECHSTELRRGYDRERDTYHTTWSELDVSCEACHGPASQHVAWAEGDPAVADLGKRAGKGLVVAFDERRGVTWRRDDATHVPVRSTPRTTQKELDTCARCHSRRTVYSEDFVPGRPLLDTHLPSLLTAPLYHADGQMRDEVYNYQSFLQSRMAEHGVTCSDCHEPHTGKTRAPGNAVCMQCHEASFDSPQHHHHAADTPAARCTSCHMPTVTYMGVDPRHDHSFKIPRPDLAARFGVPDACTGCHTDKQPQWAAQSLQQWYGRLRADRYTWTEAFAAAREHRADATALLLRVAASREQPAIVRATALEELPQPLAPDGLGAVLDALRDPDPLLRWTAAQRLADGPSEARSPLQTLLRDPVRAVRMTAARGLVGAGAEPVDPQDRAAWRAGLDEYVAAQRTNDDRPEGRLNLGNLALEQGDLDTAEREYRAAVRLHPQFAPAHVNLADLFRARGNEAACEQALRDGLRAVPASGELLHGLGLCLIRQKRMAEAITTLGAASAAAPDQARYAYVYALALQSADRLGDAIEALEAAANRHTDDPDLLELLVEFLLQRGDVPKAQSVAARYVANWPEREAARRWQQGLLR